MNKSLFLEYWKDAPKKKRIVSINGFVYYEYTLDDNDSWQSVGYDEVIVTAKFKGDDLIAISHSSHVSFQSYLEEEFSAAWDEINPE